MRKKADVIVAYISITLLLLTPFYYVFSFLSVLTKMQFSSTNLLVFAIIIDVVVVRRTFKFHYE